MGAKRAPGAPLLCRSQSSKLSRKRTVGSASFIVSKPKFEIEKEKDSWQRLPYLYILGWTTLSYRSPKSFYHLLVIFPCRGQAKKKEKKEKTLRSHGQGRETVRPVRKERDQGAVPGARLVHEEPYGVVGSVQYAAASWYGSFTASYGFPMEITSSWDTREISRPCAEARET